MYNLLEAAMAAVTPINRATATVKIHVEAQFTHEPLAGARVRVNAGPWETYQGPDQPLVARVVPGRKIRIEVSRPGWIDPRPSAWIENTSPDGTIRIGMM
ncbi:MAG: hypothetical protein RIG82_09545 [Phycisphaeraceae bacterium]